MSILSWFSPRRTVHAHCDLPCGVYDPAQARIEAESVASIQEKYTSSSDDVFRARALTIKEQRADLVKQHLWILWSDYFKPEHLRAHPHLHDLFWRATKAASEAKHSTDPATGRALLRLIDEVSEIYRQTKQQTRVA